MSFREAADQLKSLSEKAQAEARIADAVEKYGKKIDPSMTLAQAYTIIAECLEEGAPKELRGQ